MLKNKSRLLLLGIIALLAGLFFHFDLHHQLTFSQLKARQLDLKSYAEAHALLTVVIYVSIYILTTALSLPGATVLTLAGGAMFGLAKGTVIVSFASTIGATLALLTARFLLRDWVQKRFSEKLKGINAGLEREGGFFLFTLRLIPLFPFFVINLAMGLTRFSAFNFFWISQIGMLPGTMAYVNAGTQLAELQSPSGILSARFVLSFAALGILPLILKRVIDKLRARRVYRGHIAPKKFDYNVIVIGAGAGGLISAYIAAAVKAKVVLIEKHKVGGDCLNTGCVPSKALIRSAKVADLIRRHQEFGLTGAHFAVDFKSVMERVHGVISRIAPNDSMERYESLGVQCIQGEAKVISPWEVRVNDKIICARNIILATGAGPYHPKVPGLENITPLTSENLWQLRELPKRLLVVGAGPIGCEMAQSFRRLGSQVTLVTELSRVLFSDEVEASKVIEERFAAEGIRIILGFSLKEFHHQAHVKSASLKDESGRTISVEFDEVLLAMGRKAHVQGFGLEELGIETDERGFIKTDEYLRTKYPNIFAVGDCTGPYLFTHAASHQAWHAAVNALFGSFKMYKVDYSCLPRATYTDPEVATVGLSEYVAERQGIAYQAFTFQLNHLDRAITDSDDDGFVKVLVAPGSDRILGATVVGPHAGDTIAEIVFAKRHGKGLNAIMSTIHAYPTLAEANKMAAGVWKKATAPTHLLKYVERYHRWRRST